MSDELMELPEGWAQATFGDICKVQGGYAFKSQDYQEHGVLLIRISNLVDEQVQLTSNSVFLPKHYWEKFLEFQLKEGDVLIAMSGATTGKMATYKLDSPALLNQRVGRFKIKDLTATTPSYVAKLVESITEQVLQQAYGGAQPNISPKEIEEFPVPLPPLNEQKRIVAAIESLRNRSQNARSALSAIPELCDKFRQSVLAAAFRGDLTADWREQNPDVEPASALLERIRTARFRNWERNEHRKALIKGTHSENIKGRKYTEPGLSVDTSIETISPKSWLLVSVDQITFLVTDGKHGDCQDEPNSGYFFLSVKDLYEGSLHYENARQIQKQDFQEVHYRTNLEIGDVLVTNAGTIGRVAVAKDLDKVSRTTFQKSIAILKPVKEVVMFEYLAMYIENSVSHLNKQSSGTAVKNLLLRDLKAFIIALPSLEEQSEIVCRVKGLLAFANRLESSYQDAYTRFDYLDRSILAKAFRGELVEQDPNDEPASVLLERIRVDREQQMQGKIKKPGKKKRTGD